MLLVKKNNERPRLFLLGSATILVAFLISAWFCDSVSAQRGFRSPTSGSTIWPSDTRSKNQKTFRSPESAVKALFDALSANDDKRLSTILGSKERRIVFPGNEVENRTARERLVQAYQEKNRIIKVGSKWAVLEVGNEDDPFPIPIAKVGKSWHFTAKQGRVDRSKWPDQKK